MAVDIGTGVIRIEIDRNQLRRESLQASQQLQRTRTELRPNIDNARLRRELILAVRGAARGRTWESFERGGEQAMRAVGRRGVRELQQIEARGLAAAARLQRAFAGVGLAQGGTAAQAASALAGGRGGDGGSFVRASGGALSAASGGARFGQTALNIAATSSLANNLPGPLSGIAQKAATAAAANPITAAAVVAAAVGAGIVTSRYRRFQTGADQVTGARGGAFLEALGFEATGQRRVVNNLRQDSEAFRELFEGSGAANDSLARLARQARSGADQITRAYRRAIQDTLDLDLSGLTGRQRELFEGAQTLYTQWYREISEATAIQELQNSFLRGGTGFTGRAIQSGLRDQAVAARRNAILMRRQTDGLRVFGRLIFGAGGLGIGERLNVAMEFVTNRLQVWGTALVAVAATFYGLARAAMRAEQLQAAQVAAGSIAQRTLADPTAPGGEAVDISAVTQGIRRGAAGGLSELTVARTAIDAIRTGSRDIFLNTEQVLTDLRVVASATGVAFEDATTRFFRGIIKREQELLDELGIVARVQAANERYARSINVATSELTPFQQQLAFATEVQRQLTISAQQFGRESVLSTQKATEEAGRLGAEWSNLVTDIGADPVFRFLGRAGIFLGRVSLQTARFVLQVNRAQGQEVNQVSAINRLEAERNRLIKERLGDITSAALQGNLNIAQQRSLVALQREVILQQGRLFGAGPAGTAAGNLSRGNVEGAAANLTELQGVIQNLADARSRSRIAGLQGPLAALLTSIEGGGRIALLSSEAYQDLTRGTEESEEAIRLMAAVFGRSVPAVRALIEQYRMLDEETKKQGRSIQDLLRLLNEALKFGPALRASWADIADAFTTPVLQFRELIPSLDDPIPPPDFRTLPQRNAPNYTPLQIELTAIDRFSLGAAQFGLTLDEMNSNLSNFVEGIIFEGQNLEQALAGFLRGIGRALTQAASQQIGQSLFGGLFTNVVPGQPSSGGGDGLSLGDVNEASRRQGALGRVDEFYSGVG